LYPTRWPRIARRGCAAARGRGETAYARCAGRGTARRGARAPEGEDQDYGDEAMRTSLTRPDAPLWIETADLRQRKRSATSAISSSLALPSTGGALTCATQVPSSPCSSALTRERGLTFTWITKPRIFSAGLNNKPGVRAPRLWQVSAQPNVNCFAGPD